MRYKFIFLSSLLFSSVLAVPDVPNWNGVPTNPCNRPSSNPFISGDTFRNFCNHVFDETDVTFNPHLIQYADTVFVRSDVLDLYFAKYHTLIKNAYILITHNSDCAVPGQFAQFLDDPKIIAWFTVNADCIHDKLYPIPIGLSNRNWPHGNIDMVLRAMKNIPSLNMRENKAYLNIRLHTNAKIRVSIWEYFKNKEFCLVRENRSIKDYLEDIKQCRFVVSPPGNGFDCHRTWEALYMGSIPLIKHSSLDNLFIDLPVIFIDDWYLVDELFLRKQYEEIQEKKFNMKKLYIDYWFTLIKNVQTNAKTFMQNH